MDWVEDKKLGVHRYRCGSSKAEIGRREDCLRVFVDIAAKYGYASACTRFDKDAKLEDAKKWVHDWLKGQEELLERVE